MRNDSDASECLIAGSGYQKNKTNSLNFGIESILGLVWLGGCEIILCGAHSDGDDDVHIIFVSLWLHRRGVARPVSPVGRFPELKLATHMNI